MLIDVMNDDGLEQLEHFTTREKNTLDLILTSLPGQFQEIHSPEKSDHDVISGTLIIHPHPHTLPPKNKTSEKVVFVPKGKFRINEERCIRLCKR